MAGTNPVHELRASMDPRRSFVSRAEALVHQEADQAPPPGASLRFVQLPRLSTHTVAYTWARGPRTSYNVKKRR